MAEVVESCERDTVTLVGRFGFTRTVVVTPAPPGMPLAVVPTGAPILAVTVLVPSSVSV